MVEEKNLEDDEIRKFVREEYGRIGSGSRASNCCGPAAENEVPNISCCSPSTNSEDMALNSCFSNACSPLRIPADKLDEFREKYGAFLGYTNEELKSVPEGANLEGEGIMEYDEDGSPMGFEPVTETVINGEGLVDVYPGQAILTLGNRSTVQWLTVTAMGLPGVRAIGIVSEGDGEKTKARISEVVAEGGGYTPRGIPNGYGIFGGNILAGARLEITIENKLPIIMCEKTQIIQVFQNLLSNAIKYMDKPQGQIKVGCVEENGFWKFVVTDNGPGIEQKYFKRIFKIFQTLSPRDRDDSTGIGLSIVKKIVELNAGKVWVESEFGKGSTFFFTLPKQLMGANPHISRCR